MKKTLAMLLSAVMMMSFTACFGNKDNGETPETTPPTMEEPANPDDSASMEENTPDANADAKLIEARDAVKEALGEGYIPSMAFEAVMLSELYGIDMENVEAFLAEGPMMSAHVDSFIGLKAKSGKVEDVKAQLTAYRDKLVSDTNQYPTNLAKINASQIITKGDYVFFVMVGAMNDNMDASEEEQVTFATDEMKKATDAIDKVFA